MKVSEVHCQVRQFVVDNFMFDMDESALQEDTSFLESGLIDSTGILELILFLEETYGFKITDEEMLPDNLDSIAAIGRFVESKTG